MMDAIINFACQYAHSAHWIIFLLLMLAGFNLPISEDVLLLTGGAIASTCIPDHTLHLFLWIYAGCWISAWIPYWLGRHFGPRLYDIRWFHRIINPHRIEKLHYYYEKFGVFAFIVGRFCPGGVRNALFLTTGLGKMPFLTFILRDGFASLLSSSTLFYIGFRLGENHHAIAHFLETYRHIGYAILGVAILLLCIYYFLRARKTPV